VAASAVGLLIAAMVLILIILSTGRGLLESFVTWQLLAATASLVIVIGFLQSRLLVGHVRAPRRWLAIACLEAIYIAAVSVAMRPDMNGTMLSDPVLPPPFHYASLAARAAVVAGAQWWFVLRADVPRSGLWVPIMVVSLLGSTVISDALVTARASAFAVDLVWLAAPAIGATTITYLLGRSAVNRQP
jgi:hypothetical protein